MTRIKLASLACVLLAAFDAFPGHAFPGHTFPGSARVEAAELPNIVLIISDDQAWDDYSFMGHPHIQTPHLDRLAAQSLTFTRGYVPDSLCRPSLATIITGLYPHQHRIVGNDPPYPDTTAHLPPRRRRGSPEYLEARLEYLKHIDRVPTLPRMLGELGYLSHQSGKWWEGSYERGGFTHGMTHGDRRRGGRHGDEGLKIGREGMEPVFSFMDEAQQADKPFFVWYAPFLPHTPHNPPQRLFEKYQDKTDSPHIARYWAMCEWFDETCGQLLGYLDEKGIADNTIVLYVTDNGWINQPDAQRYAPRSKRSQYDGGIRTPIMVRWPGKVEPRMDKENPVNSIDLATTILAALDQQPTADMKGINLMDREAVEQREQIFGEILEHDIQHMTDPVASLLYRWTIQGDWKLIVPTPRVPDGEIELYNVKEDPYEKQNVASDHAGLVSRLRKEIEQWWPIP